MFPQYQQPMFPQYPQYQPVFQPQAPQTPRPQSIQGRMIGSLDEIQVQEVPTDGTVAWFPVADGSCVYGKRWTPDGNITTMRFVPEAQEPQAPKPDPFQVINDRIGELFDLVEDMSDRLPKHAEARRTQQKRRVVKPDAE